MSIEFAGTVSTSIVSGNRISATFSHTVGAGANRILIVIVNATSDAQTVSGITFGGAGLTLALAAATGFRPSVEIWYLVAPAVSTADVVVTMTGSLGSWGAGALNYTGVDQTTPTGATASAFFASGTDATVVINTTSDNAMIIGGITTRQAGTAATPGTGTTERYDADTGAAGGDVLCVGGDEITTTSGAVTFNFTYVSDERSAVGCVEFMPFTKGESSGDFDNATIDAFDKQLNVTLNMEGAANTNEINGVNGGVGPFVQNGGNIGSDTGHDGSARDLENGSTQFFDTAANSNIFSGAIGVIAQLWFKRESSGARHDLFGETRSGDAGKVFCRINADDTITAFVRGANAVSINTNPADTFTDTASFHHFVYIYNGKNGTVKFWVDGTLIGTVTDATVNTVVNEDGSGGLRVGDFGAASNTWDGILDAFYVWSFFPGELLPGESGLPSEDDIVAALYNAGAGRFWAADAVMPAVPTVVSLNRYEDSGSVTRQVLTCKNPTDADFHHIEFGRALDDTATSPDEILEDDGDRTISFVTIATSTDSAEFAGINAEQGPAFGPSDNFAIMIDPDQADLSAAFFARSVDVAGNASAWVKATVVTIDTDIPIAPTMDLITSTSDVITVALTTGTAGATNSVQLRLKSSTAIIETATVVGTGNAVFSAIGGSPFDKFYELTPYAVKASMNSVPGDPMLFFLGDPADTELEYALYDYLRADSSIIASVGRDKDFDVKVFDIVRAAEAARQSEYPYVTVQIIARPGDGHQTAASGFQTSLVQIDVWAAEPEDRTTIGTDVRNALDGLLNTFLGGVDVQSARLDEHGFDTTEDRLDGDGEAYRRRMDFTIRHSKSVPVF